MIFQLVDLARDLVIDFSARRSRVLLFLVAVALATGSLVTAVGIATMAARQIDSDIAASTTNVLTVAASSIGDDETAPPAQVGSGESTDETGATSGRIETLYPADAVARVSEIDTVEAVGLRIPVADAYPVLRLGGSSASGLPETSGPEIDVIAATSGYLDVYDEALPGDWAFDGEDSYQVAVVGRLAAESLGIPVDATDYSGYQISIAGASYDVLGVVHNGPLGALSVVVPYHRGVASQSSDQAATLLLRTEPGAGVPVSRVVRAAIRPNAPDLLNVSTAVDLSTVRTGVSTQLSRLAGAVGALLLVLTTLLIANSMVVAVVARTAEIGLRRALGASQGAIARLFLADGGLTGLIGGLGGSGLGCAAVVGVAVANDWSAHLEPWYLLAGPVIGLAVGLVASAYPAWQAARISPAEAVRVE